MATVEPTSNTNGTANGISHHDHASTSAEPVAFAFDPNIFRSYLVSLLPPVLGASLDELETLFDYEFEDHVTKFAGDGGVVIYIIKVKQELEGVHEYSFDNAYCLLNRFEIQMIRLLHSHIVLRFI